MNSKDKAKELVESFLPNMYCFMGSGILKIHYDYAIALNNAKSCSERVVRNMFSELDEIYPNKDGKWGIRMDYWKEVSMEIFKYQDYTKVPTTWVAKDE